MNKITYILPKTGAELDKVQDKAIRAATNARNLIQIALVATVHHLAVNHDVRVARRLVDGLHETVRGKALVQFLAQFGHLNVGEMEVTDETGKATNIITFTSIKGNAEEHAQAVRESWQACKDTMWWSLKQENPYKGFNLQEYLNNGIRQYQAALKKVQAGEAGADKLVTDVNDATIRAILALCKFDAIAPAANDKGDEAVHAATA